MAKTTRQTHLTKASPLAQPASSPNPGDSTIGVLILSSELLSLVALGEKCDCFERPPPLTNSVSS